MLIRFYISLRLFRCCWCNSWTSPHLYLETLLHAHMLLSWRTVKRSEFIPPFCSNSRGADEAPNEFRRCFCSSCCSVLIFPPDSVPTGRPGCEESAGAPWWRSSEPLLSDGRENGGGGGESQKMKMLVRTTRQRKQLEWKQEEQRRSWGLRKTTKTHKKATKQHNWNKSINEKPGGVRAVLSL